MSAVAYFGMPGGSELLVVLFVILLLFGAKKLPELSRSLGRSLGEFKKGKDEFEREIRQAENDLRKAATQPASELGGADAGENGKGDSADDASKQV